MSRHILLACALFTTMMIVPASAFAYFPPVDTNPQTPPDPFQVPGLGGLGEPVPSDPDKTPVVATPEPATIVTAVMGVALAAGFGIRNRGKNATSES